MPVSGEAAAELQWKRMSAEIVDQDMHEAQEPLAQPWVA